MAPRRIPMAIRLTRLPAGERAIGRNPRNDEKDDLAILLYAAYRGTIDDEGGTFADARAEIDRLFDGAYGRFLGDCSFVIEEGEFLAHRHRRQRPRPTPLPFARIPHVTFTRIDEPRVWKTSSILVPDRLEPHAAPDRFERMTCPQVRRHRCVEGHRRDSLATCQRQACSGRAS